MKPTLLDVLVVIIFLTFLTLVIVIVAGIVAPTPVQASDPPGCIRYDPKPPNEPSGLKGCVMYGEGTASMYGGSGVARNDCVWPFDDCAPIVITSLDTGISVKRTPVTYCDCWLGTTGPNGETARIVDLDPATVSALGLDPSRGLWRVRVEPSTGVSAPAMLPDTALSR